jgi:hypothetical protein
VWTTVDSLVLEGADPELVCRTAREAEESQRRPLPPRPASAAGSAGSMSATETAGRPAIRFVLAHEAQVALVIYDLAGRRVRSLGRGLHGAGTHEIIWDGRDDAGAARSAGVYFARLTAEPGGQWTARLMLRR